MSEQEILETIEQADKDAEDNFRLIIDELGEVRARPIIELIGEIARRLILLPHESRVIALPALRKFVSDSEAFLENTKP